MKKFIAVGKLFIVGGGLFTLQQCNVQKTHNDAKSETFVIASKQVDCTGVGKQKCYLVKEGDSKNWGYMYQSIEGFIYEPGYEYVLKVKTEKIPNPPADGSSIKYILEKVVSKDRKNSGDLPQ
ncbi:DUF4377 domain-containing protein [Elizabethkingia meningoseptica]|uniref:DUF4377 domain-containing protein n=1 Tax=Elizabethkingia meningoseptica TaxID=238 RepID=UPI0023AFEE86|nr:DUF4377 domain-containing protein [Elizabethkingia meningoseptica]MDE5490711.1 DUF4377 domain-containing protein [Elizabethkingia meningoseptica]